MITPPSPSPGGEFEEIDHFWVLKTVALGIGEVSSFPQLSTESWAALDNLLSRTHSAHLQSVDFYYGCEASEEDEFRKLFEDARSKLPNVGDGLGLRGWYSSDASDSREMAPELFGNEWRYERIDELLRQMSTP